MINQNLNYILKKQMKYFQMTGQVVNTALTNCEIKDGYDDNIRYYCSRGSRY